MARIAVYSPAAAGHVNPALGLVSELVRRGHQVTWSATAEFATRISETGAEHVPYRSAWADLADQRVPQLHGKGLSQALRLLIEETQCVLPQVVQAEPPDLVIHDGPLAWWGRHLAHRWRVPAVETWPNLVSNNEWSLTREYARFNPLSPRFLVQVARLGRMLKAGQGMDVASFMSGARASLRLVTIPRAFQYAGETFTDGYMFVGPGLTDRSFQGAWAPPKEVPVVLMSLGTAYNDRPDLYRLVLASAAGRPWHVVMAIGKIDPGTLGPIPPNVEVHAHVPQLEVLRHAGAFVTHAGMGSIMESLHARVPLIALPQMAEQRANADRLVELGLGTSLDPEHVTADVLWDAIAQAESDAHVRDQLDWMAREIKAAGGASAAADAVERLLGRNSLDPPV